jgi:hypothetical protein
MTSLRALTESLQSVQLCYDRSAFSESLTITGTGFAGSARSDIRSLCSLVGVAYRGDLVKDSTTHLVAAESCSGSNSNNSKIAKAREWGIPVVTVQWLLDSVEEGEPLPCEAYLLPALNQPSSNPGGPAPTATTSQQPKRPSSVASNIPKNLPPASSPAVQPVHRSPLATVGNVGLSDMLHRMSISPAPSLAKPQPKELGSPMFVDSPLPCRQPERCDSKEMVDAGTPSTGGKRDYQGHGRTEPSFHGTSSPCEGDRDQDATQSPTGMEIVILKVDVRISRAVILIGAYKTLQA